MRVRPKTLLVIWLFVAVSLLVVQALSLALGGRVEVVGGAAVWTTAAAVALAGTVAAASGVPPGRVRTAWLTWSVGSGAWLAGAVATDLSGLAGIDLTRLADVLWWLFAAFGLVGLGLRAAPGSFSLRFFVLDAVPVVLLTIAVSWTVLGDTIHEPAAVQFASSVYLVAYIVLALASFQLMSIDGFRRVPTNMWILGPGFILTAAAALLWPGREGSSSTASAFSALLWTTGLLLVGASGLRRALSPQGFTRLFRPRRESGARALPPAAAVVGLVTLLFFAPRPSMNVLSAFVLVAVGSVSLRFYLVRRDWVSSQAALLQSQERYRSLFDNAHDLVYTLDVTGTFTAVNQACEEITGFAVDELVGASYTTLLPPDVGDHVRQQFEVELTPEAGPRTFELEIACKDGRRATLEVSNRRVAEAGEEMRVEGIARDVTTRKLAEASLRESEERYRALFENAKDCIFILDFGGTFTSANLATEHTFGYVYAELLGRRLADFVAPGSETALLALDGRGTERRALSCEVDVVAKDGRHVSLDLSARMIMQQGRPVGWECICRDVTERKRFVEALHHQAQHDALTGLANRDLFANRVEHALARSSAGSRPTAVLFLDLDDFKVVNDSLGHQAGDLLLVELGARLRSCVRPSDICARLGGDEFGILLDQSSADHALKAAERILAGLRPPVSLGGREVSVSASIGIALGETGEGGDVLLRNADVAMYEAKARGGGSCVLFETAMLAPARARLERTTDLQHALGRGELALYYQPICELDTGGIVAFEALLRWRHPRRGIIGPAEFLDIAEETRLIVPLSRWVFIEACRQGRSLQDRYPRESPLCVSVNVSRRHLGEPGFAADVLGALTEAGLSPSSLILEITEHTYAGDLEGNGRLEELKETGVRLALDDFAAGHSSLDRLRRFPVDMLKIDRSFVRSLLERPEDAVFTETIIRLGGALGVELVAEGIEHPDERRRLLELGCRLGQGYLLAPPVDEQRLAALVAEDTARRTLRLSA